MRRLRRHRRPFAMILPLLVALAVPACRQSQGGAQSAVAEQDHVPQVVTVEVAKEDLSFRVVMPGSVLALESADLYAKVGGYLERIDVDIGDEVKQGQTLAVISIPEMLPELRRHEAEVEYARSEVDQQAAAVTQARSALATAEADLEMLESARREKEAELALRISEFERWKHLLEQSPSIERRKLDEARYQKDAAEAGLARVDAEMVSAQARIAEGKAAVQKAQADERVARARVPVAEANHAAMKELMQYAEIKAPFAGVITGRHVHPGAFIQPASTNSAATPLLRIERIDRVRVVADLPMDSVAFLNRGDRVVFENVEAAPGARFEGTVTRIAGALGQRSRMMRAEVELDNPPDTHGVRKLHSGYYGDLTVLLEEYPATPTVPASAVVTRDGELCVFSVVDGVVRRSPIEAVFEDGSRVGVGAGLSVGQQIISSGVTEVEEGERVRVRPAKEGGS